jgi:hypothetical protein
MFNFYVPTVFCNNESVIISCDRAMTVQQICWHHHMTYASIPEPPSIYPFSIESGVRLGERLGLQCLVTKGDTPLKIVWFKDEDEVLNLELPALMVRKLGEFSSTLLIEQLSMEHGGRYTCKASNRASEATHSVVLAVNGTAPTAFHPVF